MVNCVVVVGGRRSMVGVCGNKDGKIRSVENRIECEQ